MRLLKNRSIRFYLVFFLILTMAMGGSAFATFANPAAPVFKLKWGSPGTGPGQFGANLAGIAVDNNGNVYVADLSNNRIQKFTTSGVYESQWPVGAPQDVKVDASGNIWVVQSSSTDKSILKFDPNGNLLSVFTTLNDARQLAFDPAGNVYIDNHFFGQVDKFAPDGTSLTSWGTPGGVDNSFPVGIAVDGNSNVYVALNRGGGPVEKYDSVGNVLAQFPYSPFTMAIDSNNNIFGADEAHDQIVEFRPDGTLVTQWGTQGTGDGQFEAPQAVAVDNNGNVYVGDTINDNIQVFSSQDSAPPTIQCGTADGLWHATNVSIPCTASDTGSGLAHPADANFSLTTNVANGTETANASTNTYPVCDNAGNCATAGPISGNMVDKKAPSITITMPTNNATYTYQQTVTAAYSCADGGSGVATCSGPVPNGSNVDTASVGGKNFTVTATDNVGNPANQATPYAVVYSWSGVLQPINADGSSIFKLGSTVPVKFQLTGASAGVTNAVVKLYVVKIDNNVDGTLQEAVSTSAADSGNTFRYDSTSQQYIFNLGTKTLTTGTYGLKFYVGGDNTTGVLQGQMTISLK